MRTTAYPRTRKPAALRAIAAALLLFVCAGAYAEEAHTVYIPLIFHAEARDVRTTACFQVEETVYAQANWWQVSSGHYTAAEHAFKAVITAIQSKDRAALVKLTDASETADTKGFDEQANAFFRQFEVLEMLSASRSYEFDNLAVFFARFRTPQRMLYAPMVFTREKDGSFGFLPHRSRSASFQTVEDWFEAKWGPANSTTPAYCSDADIKRATHRVVLDPSVGSKTAHPGALFLRGMPIDSQEEPAVRVKARVAAIKAALRDKGIDDFVKLLTPEGGGRLKDWYIRADEKDRGVYKASVTEQQPFFLFDASPLVVVYTRPAKGSVQVIYLTVSEGNELLWTNSSHITGADKVFKSGPLYDAATGEKPFSGIENR